MDGSDARVGGGGDGGNAGPVQVRTRFEPKVRSSQQPDLDLPKQVRSVISWPWTRKFRSGSGPDLGPRGPGPDHGQSKHKTSIDSWEQKEAQVRELIYNTVDNSTFLQLKGKKPASAMWKKLSSIHRNKGAQFEEYLLEKLQTARYAKTDDMRTHLSNMNTFCEHLSEIGSPISDVQFNAYIRTSFSLTTRFQPSLDHTEHDSSPKKDHALE